MNKRELIKKLKEKMLEAENKYRSCEDRFQFEDYFQGFSDGLSDAIGLIIDMRED